MKKIALLLSMLFLVMACDDDSSDPKDESFKILGTVNIIMDKALENGSMDGRFICNYYLEGVKAELLMNDEVVESALTMPDETCDMYYVFSKAKYDTPYRIRLTLNDEMSQTSDEFTIEEQDIVDFPLDSAGEAWFGMMDWFVPGRYYIGFLDDTEHEMIFDLYTDKSAINIYPNPVVSNGYIDFYVATEDSVIIEIHDIRKTGNTVVTNRLYVPGKYGIEIGPGQADGLYFIKMQTRDVVYTTPFLKGDKGTGPAHN